MTEINLEEQTLDLNEKSHLKEWSVNGTFPQLHMLFPLDAILLK